MGLDRVLEERRLGSSVEQDGDAVGSGSLVLRFGWAGTYRAGVLASLWELLDEGVGEFCEGGVLELDDGGGVGG